MINSSKETVWGRKIRITSSFKLYNLKSKKLKTSVYVIFFKETFFRPETLHFIADSEKNIKTENN